MFFLYRLISFTNRLSSQRGFIPDIYRILAKYSLTYMFHTFIENGSFVSKGAWKRLVLQKIKVFNIPEDAVRGVTSPPLARLSDVLDPNNEFVIWRFCREFPQYLNLAQKAVRLLARVFSVKWYQYCYLCGNFILSQTEHLLLYCTELEHFRETLWSRLIGRFGIEFFVNFITNPPEKQLHILFTGSRETLDAETDIYDFLKIFLIALMKVPPNLAVTL